MQQTVNGEDSCNFVQFVDRIFEKFYSRRVLQNERACFFLSRRRALSGRKMARNPTLYSKNEEDG